MKISTTEPVRDITRALRNVTGGELKAYSGLLCDAREEALSRVAEEAEALAAAAVVTVRLEPSEIVQGAAGILASGTAVSRE